MSTFGQTSLGRDQDPNGLRSRVDQHYSEGVARAENFICGREQPAGGFMPPADLLPEAVEEWSDDWAERHLQAYVFDSIASTIPVGPASEEALGSEVLQRLCSSTGRSDYFQAYCFSRMLSGDAVLSLAYSHLADTESRYADLGSSMLQRNYGDFSEDLIQGMLTAAVTQDSQNFAHEKTVSHTKDFIEDLDLSEKIDSTQASQINLTVNVAHPSSRTSNLFLAPSTGLEAYRGAMHALGHSVFSVVAPDIIDDYGVNIAATESVAFQAQHVALTEADPEVSEFLRFLHLYQSRLYAVRAIHEASRLDSRAPEPGMIDGMGRRHLGLTALRPHNFRPKLVGVDFVIAFTEFYKQGEVSGGWQDVLDIAKNTANNDISSGVMASS